MSIMIPKWKTILTNWINCYTAEDEKVEQNITPENLLNIFTHIHESFRLDDSKSSKFEANTIQDFIVEKYPEFKFENGSLEATCEEEVYIVASLLLFFICVNSKNVDIKRVMCSKLSVGDQETIMKFSKCLMDCSPIMYADVETAIAEACGNVEKVAATPPALRSLHGEVRRLQAALDAERFDRNYLQDELARTNLKLEKLTKVKEQYKLDILSLKAKISLCCGEQRESHREARADEFIARLQRQLQEAETRLEDTLGQLDDATQERDDYKQKVADLKQERDKWLTLSQQEADKAGQLADQLDTERRTVATLRDLVSELRQHNRNNGLDSSMLECDDPDTSIHSLNLSVCNEACANVIEVQLGEERAKIEVLKQQIQSLQEQLCKTNQDFESKKLSLEAVITEKDNNLVSLTQRVDLETKEKNSLKSYYEHLIDSLNKKITDMSLTMNILEESSKNALAEKVQEIELLHKTFTIENEKLCNENHTLQKQVEEERTLKKHNQEEIDGLNNKIIEMLHTIKQIEESSQHYLSVKEQEIQSLEQQYAIETEKSSNVIKTMQKDVQDLNNVKTQCEQDIVALKNEIVEISYTLKQVEATSKVMQEEKEQKIETLQQQIEKETQKYISSIKNLQGELKEQTDLKIQCQKEISNLSNKISEMTETVNVLEERSNQTLNEKALEINTLQQQIKMEIEKFSSIIKNLQLEIKDQTDLKTQCEQEIFRLNIIIAEMTETVHAQEVHLKHTLEEKEQEIETLKQQFNLMLQEEIKKRTDLKAQSDLEISSLNNKIFEITETVNSLKENSKHTLKEKSQEIETLQQQLETLQKVIDEHKTTKTHCDQEIVSLNNTITKLSRQIQDLEEKIQCLSEEKNQEVLTLQLNIADESKKSSEMISNLQKEIDQQISLKTRCEQEIALLNNKIANAEKEIKDLEEKSKYDIAEKDQEIKTMKNKFANDTANFEIVIKTLENNIEEQNKAKEQCDQEIVVLNNEIIRMTGTVTKLHEQSKQTLEEKFCEMKTLNQQFSDETEKSNNTIHNLQKVIEEQINIKTNYEKEIQELNSKVENYEQNIIELSNKIVEMTQTIDHTKEHIKNLKLALEAKEQEKQHLQQQFTHETKDAENKIESLNEQLQTEKHTLLKLKEDFESRINTLNVKVINQKKELVNLNNIVSQKTEKLELIQSDLKKETQVKDELSSTCNQQITQLIEQKACLESNVEELQKELHEKGRSVDKLEKEVTNLKVYVSNLEDKHQNSIEEKQKLVESLNEEIQRLNDKIIEMSNTIRDQEISKHALEEKVKEWESLHQQYAADSGKSENIIKNLKIELEAEKYAQLKLKDDFDNRFMKLNEKVLNRNNELVELQNNIIQKSELIEVLQSDLRREKELREELSNACNNQLLTLSEQKKALESSLQEKLHETTELQKELQETEMFIPKLNKEIENLRTDVSSLEEKGRHRESIIKDKQKEIEFINDIFQKEQEKLNYKMDERNASIKSLQMQLQNEIEYKVQLQQKLTELQTSKTLLIKEIDEAKMLIKEYEGKSIAWEKQNIDMNQKIQANVDRLAKVKEENEELERKLESLKATQNVVANDHKAKALMWEKEKSDIKEEIQAKVEMLELDKASLLKEMDAFKVAYRNDLNEHEAKILTLEKEKMEINDQLQANVLKVQKLELEKNTLIKEMEVLNCAQNTLTRNNAETMLTVEKLEGEKFTLLKDLEALKINQNEETKNCEVKKLLLEKQATEMKEQIETNALKIEILESEKAMLLKQVEELKANQSKEAKEYEENALRWEKLKLEIEEQVKINVFKLEKLEEEKVSLMKENEVLIVAQEEETRVFHENALAWEKQQIKMEGEIQDYVQKLKEFDNERSNLIKEIETIKITQSEDIKLEKEEKNALLKEVEELKAAQTKQAKDYELNALTWEKQKNYMEEQMLVYVNTVEKLENEKNNLMKEFLTLKCIQSEESKAHEESTNNWEIQKIELEEQIKVNVLKLEQLENEKTVLQKELEEIKVTQSEETKSHEEHVFVWKKQQTEMEEQIQANIMRIMQLENEVRSLKETQDATGDQISETKDQVKINDLIVKKFEDEQAVLLRELEGLKFTEKTNAKDHEEKALLWETEKTDLNDQLRAKNLKIKDLEEEKGLILKKVGELMAAEMEEEICVKKGHEEKILMLEKEESEMKLQMQANILKMEQLEEDKVILQKEVEALKAAQKEMMAVVSQDKMSGHKYTSWERDIQGLHHQVDTTTSDLAHSSMESLKTISDLEKIIQDKNRRITSMQTETTYIKSMMAESGIKLIDVTKELEVSKQTCQELSSQLKKIVQQKNEEIAELKRQVAKMSVTENRASQIIKVSAKYQAMILKRIAEIKSTAVLKELTNFGNQNSNETELRRSLAGSVTMEDLENFLETTDRHLKRCSEKQIALQKDRDRLSEVNRINESEIINMKKFLTEMSVSFRTFTTVKEVYNQKLSKIVSLQRAVRREILSLDGRITEAAMCKLERGYAAVMQDLAECAMNLERWVDRSVSRLLSAEKIKQAFTSEVEAGETGSGSYQNAGVEVQLSELEHSLQRLLGEAARAHKSDARSAQDLTVLEVRAEYEDKLNRMKAKMKELFHEEMGRLKQKQADEIAVLERELVKSKDKMAESSRAYEEHIRGLTAELWSVGEKFLVQQEEAQWLRKQQSGSLMSLQHVHSSGLHAPQEHIGRPSDTHSLRSLPMHNKKSEGRGMHMSDEEGEVFDNRFLKELSTPRASLAPGQRISELKRRNSLVPPHLKSSYPAEMQFAPTLDEEDIKCAGTSFSLGRGQRKEVGITAYKKPGPPTPSKQAGRLSATDSELRESLRVEADPAAGRKTSTPSRIRLLFRSNRTEHSDVGTPRSRRFSNIFRKK